MHKLTIGFAFLTAGSALFAEHHNVIAYGAFILAVLLMADALNNTPRRP